MMNLKEMLDKVDFGEIDGLNDGNIERYFVNDNYWEKIIDKDTYFIIGRKGTGKSAIYNWLEKTAPYNSTLIANLPFNSFPFEKLLKLADDNFSRPNQYQSIWRNIILTEIVSLIVKDEQSNKNDEYVELENYMQFLFGRDLVDLHKQITTIAEKDIGGIKFSHASLSMEDSRSWSLSSSQFDNITIINRKLENSIINYFIGYQSENKFVVQFDQLDDNYTQYQKSDEYYQLIISLFKVIYELNKKFKSKNINAKVIGYLRSDIFNSIDEFDAESARWDAHRFDLNWSIVNRNDWKKSGLLSIINKRISTSFETDIKFHDIFNSKLLDFKSDRNDNSNNDIFRYIIHRTFHRPRDVVQFCIKIQQESLKIDKFYYGTIKNAEKSYSLWLLSELTNEISVKVLDTKLLFEFLRLLGANAFSMSSFKGQYKNYKSQVGLEDEELLRYLYKLGMIMNVNYVEGRFTEYYSIIRNEKSTFNRDLKMQLHPGFWQGLHTSTYSTR
ncbi:hypothetical protein D3C74_148230 [compost metagenome]